jgi:hypothetical protein
MTVAPFETTPYIKFLVLHHKMLLVKKNAINVLFIEVRLSHIEHRTGTVQTIRPPSSAEREPSVQELRTQDLHCLIKHYLTPQLLD